MRKIIFTLLFAICAIAQIQSQKITGVVTNIFSEPLIGANILWEGTDAGTSTDENGAFSLERISDPNKRLVFSYIGFKSQSILPGDLDHWEIQLIEDNTLANVEVKANSKATSFLDTPAKVEAIGVREIERAACCSLAGCFSTNASVVSNTTNIITDAKELRVLGLSGVYNQLLLDGIPMFVGLPYTYGSGSIPGVMIDQIFISKGTNSVLQGAEGISGQINIIPKDHQTTEKLYLNAFFNSFSESQYNVNYLHRKAKWSNFTNAHITLPARSIDRDGDGFNDVVQTKRASLFNKWSYQNPENDKFTQDIGLRLWTEKRTGGHSDFDEDLHLGSEIRYGNVTDLTQIGLYTRSNLQLKENLAIKMLNGAYTHDQDSYYGNRNYLAKQNSLKSDLILDYSFGTQLHNLKTGLSLRLNEQNEALNSQVSLIENNDYSIPGIFAEGTFYKGKFTFITGIRTDHHGEYGWKTSPRFLVRMEVDDNSDIRFSVGKGFRRAHILSEHNNLLASSRVIHIGSDLQPEEALNLGINFVKKWIWEDVVWTLAADAYYTDFQNQVFPHLNGLPGEAHIHNFFGTSRSESFQIESKIELDNRIDFMIAYNYLDIYRIKNDIKTTQPFVVKHHLLSNVSFATPQDKYQIDVTLHHYGSKTLPDLIGYPIQYQDYATSEAYQHLSVQFTRRWDRFEVYTGMENIFDFRQEFPILAYDDPFGPYFDAAFTWGPTKGREIYLGLRYKLK